MRATRDAVDLGVALVRQDGTAFTHKARILPPTAANAAHQPQVRRAAGQVPALAEGRLHDPGGGLPARGEDARRRLRREGPPRLRPGPGGPPHVRAADRGRGGEEAPAGARDPAAPRPPPRRLPDRVRPRRLRPQVRGGGGRQGRLLRRGGLEPLLREGPLVPLRGNQRHAAARRRPPAAHRRDRRQRGRRLRQQRAPRRLALPQASPSPTSTGTSAGSSARSSRGGAGCPSRS